MDSRKNSTGASSPLVLDYGPPELKALRVAVLRASERRSVAPTQEHPRECRCIRSTRDGEGCFKCGLPVAWVVCSATVKADVAAFCRREHERTSRRERRRRT